MEKLLLALIEDLVEDKSAINITADEADSLGVINYRLRVAPADMGRVIGKQGRIAKSVRAVMRAGAARHNQKINLEIE